MFNLVHLCLDEPKNIVTLAYTRSRSLYYSTLVLLTGIFILVVGACVTSVDPGPHSLAAPPVFVIYSGWPIATGAIAMCVGGFGIIAGLLEPTPGRTHTVVGLTIFNFLWQIAVMVLYQPPAMGNFVAAVPIACLIMSQLIPAYFHVMRLRLKDSPANESNIALTNLDSGKEPRPSDGDLASMNL